MMRVLITGGTGVLGRQVVQQLLAQGGCTLRLMSRSPVPQWQAVEWARADLENDAHLEHVTEGVHTLVHLASNPFNSLRNDVEGTAKLLKAARTARVAHFVYVSIVGIDRIPLEYYQRKLLAERLIESSEVPSSILRVTQFHTLIDLFFRGRDSLPIKFIRAGYRYQPIDPREAARRVVEMVGEGAGGHVPDIGGPEVLGTKTLMRTWLAARREKRLIVPIPRLGKVAQGYRRGYNTVPESRYGQITWAQWVNERYQ